MNNATLGKLASVSERIQACPVVSALGKAPTKKEVYRWGATNPVVEVKETAAMSEALKKVLEHEKMPELVAKLTIKTIERDSWVARMSQLSLPKLVEQVMLNAWKEESSNVVCLHLRSTQRYPSSSSA